VYRGYKTTGGYKVKVGDLIVVRDFSYMPWYPHLQGIGIVLDVVPNETSNCIYLFLNNEYYTIHEKWLRAI
jgi:hypothetical protein